MSVLLAEPLHIDIDRALVANPIVVSPETPLKVVLDLMERAGRDRPSRPLANCMEECLQEERGSFALVMAGDRLAGIFTQQDLLQRAAKGLAGTDLPIARAMVPNPAVLPRSRFCNASTALDLLRQHGVRHLPVLDDAGRVLGAVTSQTLRFALHANERSELEERVTQCELLETKLQDSELQLQHILAATCDIVLICGKDRSTVEIPFVRGAIANSAGTADSKIVRATVDWLLGEENSAGFYQCVDRVLDKGRSENFEYALSVGNRTLFFESNIGLLSEDKVICVARDITARLQAEKKTQHILNHLQFTLRELSYHRRALDEFALLSIANVRGEITYANHTFCEVSQYSLEELLGQTHQIICSGNHPPDFFQEMWKTIASGCSWRGEIKNRKKDGSFYWIDALIVPFLGENQKPFQYLAICNNITRRKQVQEELERSRSQLEELVTERTADLDVAIARLTEEVDKRKHAEEVLVKINEDLELRVDKRTALLRKTNQRLRQEAIERQKAEASLRESEELFRTLSERSPVGIFKTDVRGKLHLVEPALAEDGWIYFSGSPRQRMVKIRSSRRYRADDRNLAKSDRRAKFLETRIPFLS